MSPALSKVVAEVKAKYPEHLSFMLAIAALTEVAGVTLSTVLHPIADDAEREAHYNEGVRATAHVLTMLARAYAEALHLPVEFQAVVAQFAGDAGDAAALDARLVEVKSDLRRTN